MVRQFVALPSVNCYVAYCSSNIALHLLELTVFVRSAPSPVYGLWPLVPGIISKSGVN